MRCTDSIGYPKAYIGKWYILVSSSKGDDSSERLGTAPGGDTSSGLLAKDLNVSSVSSPRSDLKFLVNERS
jgi:hypothetical protein